MMIAQKLVLKKGKEAMLDRRHPWIFSGALYPPEEQPTQGAWCRVESAGGQTLAFGHWSPGSIAVRILQFGSAEPNVQQLYEQRIRRCWELRQTMGLVSNDNTIFRLVHGEGDYLPGLVADCYGETLVLQAHSAGMHADKQVIASACQNVLGSYINGIYFRTAELPTPGQTAGDFLYGQTGAETVAIERGMKLKVNWADGQKTGFFIDQRENRSLLRSLSQGKSVLNTFSYTGGFSVAALLGGAQRVVSVDSSQRALDLCNENVEINEAASRHESVKADALEYVRGDNSRYDIVVLDPPAFAKHQSHRHRAVQAYKRLNADALKTMKPGSLLLTFSCSQAVDKVLFTNTLVAAALESGRKLSILQQLHQPADHPIHIHHPEGEYLKGLLLRVDD